MSNAPLDQISLPPLCIFGGDWHVYEAELYEYFLSDFQRSKPTLAGRPVTIKKHPLDDKGRAYCFCHLTSTGPVEGARTPDLRRCERIRWPRRLIDCASQAGWDVRCWETFRRAERRILIALPEFDYVVVLADRGKYLLLLTAYCVERGHRRRKLENEWHNGRLAPPLTA